MKRFFDSLPLLLLAVPSPASPLSAQTSGAASWDTPRVLWLVDAARERRAGARTDGSLRDYQTRAEGYVYFYLDREDTAERVLIKVDQIALDVYWAAPDQTKQRIVGMRDVSKLPNRQHYHIDHLAIVQDEFPDVIRLGDGDEVQAVTHPVAPGAESVYSYRLADSLTIRLPGAADPVRVYRIDVRPRHADRPGYVGSIYVDRATAALVRLSFTFTPASYVDRRLDYIRISLDNGLWEGRHWLPHEQRIEIRREVPELDFPAGSVIRGVFRVGGYEFNQELPPAVFRGPPIVALPRELREAYAFERGILDGLADEDLAPSPELERLEAQARELISARFLSGLPNARLRLGSASSALRFNRSEGLYLGAGATFAAAGTLIHTTGGWAFGAEHAVLAARVRPLALGRVRPRLGLYMNAPRDIGPVMPAPGVLNTFSAAFVGRDWLDPYYADGGMLGIEARLVPNWTGRFELEGERHQPAARTVDEAPLPRREFRDVLAASQGRRVSVRLGALRDAGGAQLTGWTADAAVRLGDWDGSWFARPTGRLGVFHGWDEGRQGIEFRLSGAANLGALPPQHLYLLGGPGTLPGHAYRSFAGSRYALLEAETHRDLAAPWLRVRAFASAGWTGGDISSVAAAGLADSHGVRASAGAGIGVFYDLLRLHIVRGLNGGNWGLLFSVRSAFEELL